ncbi:MAG: MFS transporter [Terrimicrobiaceae bacterium]
MSDRAFVYAAIVIGTLAISLDFASVDLALPALEAQYGLDLVSVQWVINGYVLAFAVLMVAGGRLADGYGRRNVFLIGMAIFAVASRTRLRGGCKRAAWDLRPRGGMGGL